MSKRGTEHFAKEIDLLIDRYRKEYEMTYAEVVGALTIAAIRLCGEDEDEDSDEGTSE